MTAANQVGATPDATGEGITALTICGYKSLAKEHRMEIRPLTILAGANSSGKSSVMQPVLLLKQTLDATTDPGPLLLDGPNVKFTAADQFFSKCGSKATNEFSIDIELANQVNLKLIFQKPTGMGIDLSEMVWNRETHSIKLRVGMSSSKIESMLSGLPILGPLLSLFTEIMSP